MNNFVAIRPFKAFNKVTFYTFHVEGRELSETDSFFSAYEPDEEVAEGLNTLVTWIQEIGQKRGAMARYFRFEDSAGALPPPARIMLELSVGQCDLRLYCVRLTDEVVILANGGRKTSQAIQDSPALLPKFRFANKMANQLLALMQQREISVQGPLITNLEAIELWD